MLNIKMHTKICEIYESFISQQIFVMQAPKRNFPFATQKGNQIWLASLSYAWQQFEKQMKFTIEIPQNADYAKQIIQNLKNFKCDDPNGLDSALYYRAGARAEAANTINKNLLQNFPQELFSIEKVGSVKHDQVVFYGALYKKIQLSYPFYNIPGKIMHFRRSKVPCFQPLTAEQRSQVFVANYISEDNFMVRIDCLQKGSQMFILMTKSKKNLEEALEFVKKSDDEVEPMTNNDTFKIPQIKIKATHITTQLSNVKLKFPNQNKKYQISQLIESVQLQMVGVPQKDQIDKITLFVPETETPKLKQRRMCANNPFWIILKDKGCDPYFAIFVHSATDV